jgi:histidinol dehydrogenase
MRIIDASNVRAIERLAARDLARDPAVARQAARIVRDVRRRGDRAVADWTRRLDGASRTAGAPAPAHPAPLSAADIKAGWAATDRDVRAAIRVAIANVRAVATRQVPKPFAVHVRPGVRVEQRVAPLGRVGCYVPGGRYPLPSTLVMTAVPALVAGVREVVVVCPRPAPAVLAAALEAGVTDVWPIGGAQAIAALAYGTACLPRVDKIVGPGNAWVAAAKALVSADCAIDFHAGPSEIVIVADEGPAEWIAADLIAQAEHDPAARAVLVTTRRSLAGTVAGAVQRQLPDIGPARAAIRRNGAIVVARTPREAEAVVNRLAPEHLVCERQADVGRFTAAGTIFVGRWSAQAAGDYCTGSNHVLPTGGAARFRGGLSAADFVRVFSVQTLTARGIRAIGPPAVALATAEGLAAHAESIRKRLAARSTPHEARRTKHAARSTPHEAPARSTEHGARSTNHDV